MSLISDSAPPQRFSKRHPRYPAIIQRSWSRFGGGEGRRRVQPVLLSPGEPGWIVGNTKAEYRNPKQIQNPEGGMFKAAGPKTPQMDADGQR